MSMAVLIELLLHTAWLTTYDPAFLVICLVMLIYVAVQSNEHPVRR